MAFDTPADLTEGFSAQVTLDIRGNAVWLQVADRQWEPMAQTNYTVHIPDPTYIPDAGNAYDRDTGAAGTRNQPSQVFIDLLMDQYRQWNGEIPYLANMELPVNYVDLERRRFATNATLWIDDNLRQYVAGLTYDADHSFDYGDATNNIDHDTGAAANATTMAYPYQALRRFMTAMGRLGAITGMGDRPGLWAIMPPEVFDVLGDYLLEQKYYDLRMPEDRLRGNTLFSVDPYRGRLFDAIDIYTSTAIPKPSTDTASDATQQWTIHMGVMGAYAAAVRSPIVKYFPPTVNQGGTHHLFDYVVFMGRVGVNTGQLFRATIDAG